MPRKRPVDPAVPVPMSDFERAESAAMAIGLCPVRDLGFRTTGDDAFDRAAIMQATGTRRPAWYGPWSPR